MDAVYSINLQKVNNVVDDLGDIKKSLVASQTDLERVKNNLDKGTFKDVINVLERLVEEDYSEKVATLQNVLREMIAEYTKTEEMLLKEKINFNKLRPQNTEEGDSSIWDNYKEGFWDNFLQELLSTLLTSGSYRLASLINMLSAFAKGPDGPNSFVILDPSVANSTSKFLKTISKGLTAIGFAIDFGTQIAGGESLKDALIKSGAHLAIGAAVGAIVGSVIPGPGTVAGAVVGLAIGAVVTYGANTFFDYIYDDPQGFLEDVENCWDKVTNVVSNVADKIGNAVSSVSGTLGTIFVG